MLSLRIPLYHVLKHDIYVVLEATKKLSESQLTLELHYSMIVKIFHVCRLQGYCEP